MDQEVKPKRIQRELDEKRIALLLQMTKHRVCIGSKATMQPLLRRNLVESIDRYTYRVTRAGRGFADKFMKTTKRKRLCGYEGIISIGGLVMIL